MPRIQIIGGTTTDGFPPLGSVGNGTYTEDEQVQVLFVPDNIEHYPPDCPMDEFGGYGFRKEEIEEL